jgi:hypothetical protein
MSVWGKEIVTNSAVMPEVDWMIGYFHNLKHDSQVFCVDIYREETERRWQIPRTQKDKKLMNSKEKGGMEYNEYITITKVEQP